ncbi:hypothetical protein PPL_03021 [Heterostelium album PN500]|uniref:Corrinoid adenosyltransferase MMAB n=1 Tax=Heterostelium pallidum (strain ATCC 26659 / Pp 5 / PN500) TaxID=670386 RepID=D3B3Q3_HETP5|nr:hypothetical protein PPL_03021 [Heterostelium album PN500]EFA83951.1 hypothetical protein PPL_03021 [Heterostelium album PN500]|eukprot:XP_020436068.1 hypothetical protein PPL_03021 [Heterostelium album PN500]
MEDDANNNNSNNNSSIEDNGEDLKRSRLYTKTGDKGYSSLFNGERKPKDDDFFNALGNIDELNASLGVALEYCMIDNNGLQDYIEKIQSLMLDVGACCATPLDTSKDSHIQKTKFSDQHVIVLERWIDLLDSKLPPLKNFIVPCGVGLASSHLHLSRAICRRAERSICSLSRHQVIPENVSVFMNRLSDFLFAACRYAAMKSGKNETLWKKREFN